jgi:hypothetical protein
VEKINRRIETLTEQGAQHLAFHVRRHWAIKGKTPKVWVEAVDMPGGDSTLRSIFVVRSDMVGGQPR